MFAMKYMEGVVKLSPEQRVYTTIRRICVDLYGEDNVYDKLPGDVPYPFIHVGDQFSQNVREHKDFLNKDTQVVIHVWHNDWRERGRVSQMMYRIEKAVLREFKGKGNVTNSSIIPDNTTKQPLLHGILDLDIRI